MKNLQIAYDGYEKLLQKQNCQIGMKRTERFYSQMQNFGNFTQDMNVEYHSGFQNLDKLDRKNSQNGLWMFSRHTESRKKC